MKRLSMVVAATTFVTLVTVATKPAHSALLDFSFTTNSGGAGTFTLNTDTSPSPEPALFRITGLTGISYPSAISNFSFSASYIDLSNVTIDWVIAPSITSNLIGFPANLGVLSGASYPSGCITASNSRCLFTVGVIYTGKLSELPILSNDPNSYLQGPNIDFVDATTEQLLISDNITNFRVVRRIAIPESNFGLSILVFGISSVSLLLKRKFTENWY